MGEGSCTFRCLVSDTPKSYFQIGQGEIAPKKIQTGVVRTNCMDNLDRTNVVQAALAKYTLNNQLRDLGILSPDDGIDDYEGFSKEFRECESISSCALSIDNE